jgi:hypothetical protein
MGENTEVSRIKSSNEERTTVGTLTAILTNPP